MYKVFDAYRDILDVDDVAEMLGIKPYKVYQLLNEKKLKRLNIGKPYKIPKYEVIRFVESAALV